MIQRLIFFFSITMVSILTFTYPPDTLVGRWQKRIEGVGLATVNYRPDGSYDAFVNGKAFVSGRYAISKDTIRMTDEVCNPAYAGTYRLLFFGPDSIRYEVLEDTCRRRRNGTHGLTLGRIKPVPSK